MSNRKSVHKLGRNAIQQIARREGVPEAAIRTEMALAIQSAYDRTAPLWANSPSAERMPTPEEFIVWTTELLK